MPRTIAGEDATGTQRTIRTDTSGNLIGAVIDTTTVDVTIANGQTTSGEAALSNGQTLVGVFLPASLTSTTMTFTTATAAGGTFVPVYDVGGAAAYSITVGTSRYVPVDPRVFAGIRYLKAVGGSTESGSRTITLVVRNV